jgi:hypothetical protein
MVLFYHSVHVNECPSLVDKLTKKAARTILRVRNGSRQRVQTPRIYFPAAEGADDSSSKSCDCTSPSLRLGSYLWARARRHALAACQARGLKGQKLKWAEWCDLIGSSQGLVWLLPERSALIGRELQLRLRICA